MVLDKSETFAFSAGLRTTQSDHEIGIVLKEDAIKLPTGETAGLCDPFEQFALDLLVLTVNRAANLPTDADKNIFQSLVQGHAITGKSQFDQNVPRSLFLVVVQLFGKILRPSRCTFLCCDVLEESPRSSRFNQCFKVVNGSINLAISSFLAHVARTDCN